MVVAASRGNAHYHSRDGLASADYEAAFRLDPEAVLKSCRTHLRHDPDDIMAYARRGLTLLWLGRDADAGPDFDRMRQLEPEWRPHLDLWIEGRPGASPPDPGGPRVGRSRGNHRHTRPYGRPRTERCSISDLYSQGDDSDEYD